MAQKGTRDESNAAIANALTPIRKNPTVSQDVSVTTSPAVLFADDADAAGANAVYLTRRVRVVNTSSTATLGIFIREAGTDLTGLTIANSARILPNVTWEFSVGLNMRVGAISSSGTITANVLVSDLG